MLHPRRTCTPGQRGKCATPRHLPLTRWPSINFAQDLGGRGCIVKDGFIIKQWGDQAQVGDWMSSSKPVLSTLLFFAIEEGLVKGVDQPISDFGWELKPKDQPMTFAISAP